jgi:hypothetical protein
MVGSRGLSCYKLTEGALNEMEDEWKTFFQQGILSYEKTKHEQEIPKVKGNAKRIRESEEEQNPKSAKRVKVSAHPVQPKEEKKENKNTKPAYWENPHYLAFQVPLYIASTTSLLMVQSQPKISRPLKQKFSKDDTTLVSRILLSMQGTLGLGEFLCWAYRRIMIAPILTDLKKRFPHVEPVFKVSNPNEKSAIPLLVKTPKEIAREALLEKSTEQYAILDRKAKQHRKLASQCQKEAVDKHWDMASEYLFRMSQEENCKVKVFSFEPEDPQEHEDPQEPKPSKYVGLSIGMRAGRVRELDEKFMKEKLPILINEEFDLPIEEGQLQKICERMTKKFFSKEFRGCYPPSYQIYSSKIKERGE